MNDDNDLSESDAAELRRLRFHMADYEWQIEHARYWQDVAMALIEGLKSWPEIPPPSTLALIGGFDCCRYPDDLQRGKTAQHELGLSVIPPDAAMEMGAGFWLRITEHARAAEQNVSRT